MNDTISQRKVALSKDAQDILLILAYVIDHYGDEIEDYPDDSYVKIDVMEFKKFTEENKTGDILLEFVDDAMSGDRWWRVRRNKENNKELLERLNDGLQEQENSNPA
jgi:hypothetical protein